jgi:hypothetical protein
MLEWKSRLHAIAVMIAAIFVLMAPMPRSAGLCADLKRWFFREQIRNTACRQGCYVHS